MQIYNVNHIKNAIQVYQRCKSFRKTALITQISKSTIHRWWNKFHNLSINYKFQKRKNKKRKRKPKYKNLENIIEKLFINKTSIEFFTLESIQKYLQSNHYISPSLQWINHVLKKMKISKRKFNTIKIQTRNQEEIYDLYKKHQIEKEQTNNEIICLDETSFCNLGTSNEGYFLKGKNPTVYNVRKRISYSVLMAINKENIISYEINDKAYNTYTFFNFIKQLINKLETQNKETKFSFLMDNVAFHKSKHIKHYIISKGHSIIFIPPYTPQCNPIEELFSEIKRKYRQSNEINMKKKIINSINNVNKKNIPSYYLHSENFIKGKIKNEINSCQK